MKHKVSVERDDYTKELFWRQDDLVARFFAFESDVVDMLDTRIRLAAGDLRLGRRSDDYVKGYCDALEEYTEELEFILRLRFKEIMKEIEKNKSSDEGIDLGDL